MERRTQPRNSSAQGLKPEHCERFLHGMRATGGAWCGMLEPQRVRRESQEGAAKRGVWVLKRTGRVFLTRLGGQPGTGWEAKRDEEGICARKG